MHVRTDLHVLLQRNKFRKVGIQLPVRNHVSKALEVIGGIVYSGLGQAHALLFAMNAEERMRLTFKEVRQVFAEDHGHTGQVAQSGHDTTRLQLGKKAGGKTSVPSE